MNIASTYSMPSAATIFGRMDKNGDGGISADEFGGAANPARLDKGNQSRQSTFQEIDANSDGVISEGEFKAFHEKLEAKIREVISHQSLLDQLGPATGETENRFAGLEDTTAQKVLDAMKAKTEDKGAELSGVSQQLFDLIDQLKKSLKPGDLLNVEA